MNVPLIDTYQDNEKEQMFTLKVEPVPQDLEYIQVSTPRTNATEDKLMANNILNAQTPFFSRNGNNKKPSMMDQESDY